MDCEIWRNASDDLFLWEICRFAVRCGTIGETSYLPSMFEFSIEERMQRATAILAEIREALEAIVEDAHVLKEYIDNATE